MREVINISLSPMLALEVKKAVKKGKYSSTSEFFRSLVKMYNSEQFLFQDIEASYREYKQGKIKELKSFKDLD